MSKNVVVIGLPADAVFPKLIFSFKGLFRKININKFWIRELSAVFGANYKQMTVEFISHTEARKARNFLNNLPFVYGKMEYHLQADMAQASEQYETDDKVGRAAEWGGRGRGRRAAKRERHRSPSPAYSREASKLDMEIELLRKQRQVIEEERRLLLEQKKLEMIREYGPSASREFSDYEDYESYDYESYEPPRKRRHPEPAQAKKLRHSSPPMKRPERSLKNKPKGLPLFFQPCRRLMSDMKQYIDKDTSKDEAEILTKLVRAAIRKKIAIALEGKDYMPTRDILKLYREKHPKGEDEGFVASILSNIRASFLVEAKAETDEVDAVKVKQESVVKNEEGDTKDKGKEENDAKDKEKVAESEEVAEDVAQETPANGENGTDTTAAEGDDVKPGPDVSQDSENGNISANVNADILEIKSNYSMINNTVLPDEAEAEDKLEDVQTEAACEAEAAKLAIDERVGSMADP